MRRSGIRPEVSFKGAGDYLQSRCYGWLFSYNASWGGVTSFQLLVPVSNLQKAISPLSDCLNTSSLSTQN